MIGIKKGQGNFGDVSRWGNSAGDLITVDQRLVAMALSYVWLRATRSDNMTLMQLDFLQNINEQETRHAYREAIPRT